jgi:WS/DGAT/MGAT family acyltransferase
MPLSAEDLSFWAADQPRQRTTMAMLMRLDRPPDAERLLGAAARAVEAVPRLSQRVVDAPFDLARPRWEDDPTFDLEFHVRRSALPAGSGSGDSLADLFHALSPIYEQPFDRSRPLWEMHEIDHPHGAAIFFKLHHAVADGVGGNAILAALTDADRDGAPLPPRSPKPPGGFPEEASDATRLLAALRDRVGQDAERGRAVAGAAWQAIRDPSALLRAGRIAGALARDLAPRGASPLRALGRARRLTGFELPFEPLREARRALGGRMIDVLLTGVAGAVGTWYREHGLRRVTELVTLVPINLRPRGEQGLGAGVGNRATGILVPLPIARRRPRARFREIHRRVEERTNHPSAEFFPVVAELLAVLPRPLYRRLAHASSSSVELIVTNVPGVPMPRYVAGAEITAAYPFAPVAPHCPISIALYGYRGRLFVGIDADATAVPDPAPLGPLLEASFEELLDAAGVASSR